MSRSIYFLIITFALCQYSFADEYEITNSSLKISRSNAAEMTLNFTLIDVPTEDFPGSSPTADGARTIMVKNLDICLENGSCDTKLTWKGYSIDQDDTEENDLDDDRFLEFTSVVPTKDNLDEEYDIDVSIKITTTVEDQTFQPGAPITLRYVTPDRDREDTLVATTESFAESAFEDLTAFAQNLGVVATWQSPETIQFADGTTGPYAGARVFIKQVAEGEQTEALAVVEKYVFEDDPVNNPENVAIDNGETLTCTLSTNTTSSPSQCTFTCTNQGFINTDLAATADIEYGDTDGNAISFVDLDITSYYALIPQMQSNGLLIETSPNSGTFVAECVVMQPTESYTYAQLSGGGASKQGDPSCFIATAAYGTPLHQSLDQLRWFRDHVLTALPLGEKIISLYYELSPTVAEKVVFNEPAKALIRAGLWAPVKTIEVSRRHPYTVLFGTITALSLLGFLVRSRKQA